MSDVSLAPLRLADIKAVTLDENRWLWDDYLARSKITLLTGQWKAGKTTLIAMLIDRATGLSRPTIYAVWKLG